MIVMYAKTFSKKGQWTFPLEDRFYASQDIAVVADGITRDSIGCPNLATASAEEIYRNYPNPSPAACAAEAVCTTFRKNRNLDLGNLMELANENIKAINANVNCDYLENDYVGCVAAAAVIKGNVLHYSYICDCGVVVWNKEGRIKFKTKDDKAEIDPYIDAAIVGEYSWDLPAGRRLVREHYRNNLSNPFSYGALTGEESAKAFIRQGMVELEETDIVAVFSDGFTPYFTRSDFFQNLGNLDSYVQRLEGEKGLGREKTIIVVKP